MARSDSERTEHPSTEPLGPDPVAAAPDDDDGFTFVGSDAAEPGAEDASG